MTVKKLLFALCSILSFAVAGIFAYALFKYFIPDLSIPLGLIRVASISFVILFFLFLGFLLLRKSSNYFRKSSIIKTLTFGPFGIQIAIVLFIVNIGLYKSIAFFSKAVGTSEQCFTTQDVQRACFLPDPKCYYINQGTVYEQGTCASPHNCAGSTDPANCHPCGTDVTGLLPRTHVAFPQDYLIPNLRGYIVGTNSTCPVPTPTDIPTPTEIPTPTIELSPTITPTPDLNASPTVTPNITITPTTIKGDANGDNTIDIQDLTILVQEFGQTGNNLQTDFNHDGKVDILDFNILLRAKVGH